MVTINYSAYSASFATKTVANGKPVTVSGVTLSGGDAGNYTVSQPSGLTANITALHITGSFTVDNKIYDGNNSATVLTRNLSGVIAPDVVSLTDGTATFSDKNVGNGKTVTLTGASLTGTDAANYVLDSLSTTTANITAQHITRSFTASSKVYDGYTSATVLTRSLSGTIMDDVVSLTGGSATFSDKSVGNGKTVALTGASLAGTDSGNYVLDSVSTTTANITALHITGSFSADNKVYDGNTSATVLTRSLSGTISGDMVSLDGGTATFNDKTVGTGKTVTLAGASLTGGDAANYALDSVATTIADITAKNLTINGAVAQSKTYDSYTTATVDFMGASLVGVVFGDMVTINSSAYAANFNDKNVGTGKAVTVTGVALSGGDAGNYTVSQPSGLSANITVLHITGSFTASNKVYDSNTSATVLTRSLNGAISGDMVSLAGGTATFSDKTVATGKTVTLAGASLTGTNAGNYELDSVSTTTADITALHITGSFTVSNKVYDGNTSATVLTRSLNGAISGDVVSLSGGTATFNDKNAGNGKTVMLTGASLTGTDAVNYILDSIATATANITVLHITGSFTADNKVYDGNTSAIVLTRSLSGTISGDVVMLTGGTATFSDKNVGNGKTVTLTGASLSGTDAGNYALDSVGTTTANITVATVTAAIIGNPTKTYDGNTNATLTTANFSLTGVVTGESITVTKTTGTYNSKDVATATTVTTSLASGDFSPGGGTLLSNYMLPTSASGPGHINPATLSMTADSIVGTPAVDPFNKVYDGLVYTGFTVRYSGFVNSETPSVLGGSLSFSGAGTTAVLPGGPYTVTPGGLTSTTYTNTFVNGTLNIGYGTCTGPNPGGVILPPINSDGSSVWKVGSTVPVKFTVCDANGNPIGPDPSAVFATGYGSITLINTVRGTVNNVNETTYADIPDSAFRWSNGIWIFNMATSNLTKNTTYTFRINLKDGSYIQFSAGTK